MQRAPYDSKTEAANDLPYREEFDVISVAVGQIKLGRLVAGSVFYGTKDWTATGMSSDAFYAGPFFSDMGHFYYVYRFVKADPNTTN